VLVGLAFLCAAGSIVGYVLWVSPGAPDKAPMVVSTRSVPAAPKGKKRKRRAANKTRRVERDSPPIPQPRTPTSKTKTWDGTEPFVCTGNDIMRIEKVNVTFRGSPAISAIGNCKLVISDSTLSAPIVVEAGGNAAVDLRRCTIVGSTTGISAGGNAKIDIEDSTLNAPVVIEAAGNTTVKVGRSKIVASRMAVDATGLAKVNIANSTVQGPINQSGLAKVQNY
jgi:hypothetical protein